MSACQLITSLNETSANSISFISTATLHLQVNTNLYLLHGKAFVGFNDLSYDIDSRLLLKGSLHTVVKAATARLLHLKLVDSKTTLIQTNADYSETIVGELIEVLPRSDFSCCQVSENKFALYGGCSPSGEILSDIFTFTIKPPDPIRYYTNSKPRRRL